MTALNTLGPRALRHHRENHPGSFAVCAVLLVLMAAAPASSQPPRTEAAESHSRLQVYAYTLRHQPVHEALAQIRDLLSQEGTVEVQAGGNTLVIRDFRSRIARVVPVLKSFDHPPQNLRFDIRIVRAGPKRQSRPPAAPAASDHQGSESESGLSEQLEARLRSFLRYDDYQVLARAAITSREREEVTYSLGNTYSVSFRPGALMDSRAGQRLKLEGFRIYKHPDHPTNKGRRLEPEELFHATLNLWIGRPFSLVLTQDEARQEALLIAISCRREAGTPDDTQ
ncbi:MAG: hypothetical protein V3T72_14000 [Thermoanaerobaculia bacterium]